MAQSNLVLKVLLEPEVKVCTSSPERTREMRPDRMSGTPLLYLNFLYNRQPNLISTTVPEVIFKPNKRQTSIRLKIDAKGQVVVSYPWWTPRFVAQKFVEAQKTWIEENLARLATKRELNGNEHEVLIFGKKYTKQLLNSFDLPYGVTIKGEDVLINSLGEAGKSHATIFDRFLKNTAEKYLIPRTHALAKVMKLEFKNITLRQQKSRWGSCSSQKNLNFNWRLVHYSPAIIDYVIIHELSHLVEMNHSGRFWDLVGKHDPEYAAHRGYLKRYGMALG